jgi:hypothetical protein
MGAGHTGNKGRGAGKGKTKKSKAPFFVPSLSPELIDPALQQITKRIPAECLAQFENVTARQLYASILLKLVEETIPEGSTILQVLVAERAAYYWTVAHSFESTTSKGITEEYKFYVYEFNRNLEILRSLAIRNLPAIQVRLLAKKTINVIERIIKNPEEKDAIIKEIIHEFTIEVSNIGFKKQQVQLDSAPS